MGGDRFLTRELRSLRFRLSAWYVSVFGVILLGFGFVIYQSATRRIEERLDQSLAGALDAVEDEVRSGAPSDVFDRLRIPGRELYVFEADGSPVAPTAPPDWVIGLVANAGELEAIAFTFEPDEVTGVDDADGDGEEDPDWRVSVRPFNAAGDGSGAAYIAVAATNALELDDEYGALILTLSVAAFIALLLAGLSGVLLARRASAPVKVAFQQMRRFAADAAHELKTPLATIRARAETSLANGSLPESDRVALTAIADEGRRLGDVVDRLLFLARSDVQKIKVDDDPIHLDDVMFEALPAAQALADEKGIQIHLAVNGNCAVVGDPLLLRHLLSALLENAIKFSPPESEVEVETTADNGRVKLSVRDFGPGVPPELQSHVFEPFYRADPSGIGPGGVGLGLSIVRRIAQAHDGQVEIQSPEGGGTAVEASFPRA